MLSPLGSCDGLIGKRIVTLDSDTVLHMKTPFKGGEQVDHTLIPIQDRAKRVRFAITHM